MKISLMLGIDTGVEIDNTDAGRPACACAGVFPNTLDTDLDVPMNQ